MSTVHFRRATSADALAVQALSRLAYQKWVPLIGREPLPMTADYERAVVEHLIDLWEENGQLLGLAEMVPGQEHLLLENLAVRPDQQGKGRGSRLLLQVETVAVSLGLTEIRLYTNAVFAANAAFYAKRGYSEYQRTKFARGGIAVHMHKFLGEGKPA